MKMPNYEFDTTVLVEADRDLNRIEAWFRNFCRRKHAKFDKNHHNSPTRDLVASCSDGIIRKLQLHPVLTRDGRLQAYWLSVIAWRDTRGFRNAWWGAPRK